MARVSNEQIMAVLGDISKRFDKIENRVAKLENASKPQPAGKPTKSVQKGNPEKTTNKKSVKISDFEPKGKKVNGKYTNWRSYKAQRKAYCIAVATDGKYTDSQAAYKDGVVVDYEGKKYTTAKAEYTKKYAYLKVADR